MFDITAFGEILIDYTPAGLSESGMALFEQNPGGAPANVLACAAKLGQRTAFIGKVGKDMQGDFLRTTLQQSGINHDLLLIDDQSYTTLAFVSLTKNGERSFSFARKPGADTQLRSEEIDPAALRSSRIFHFGSLSLTHNPARETTHFLLTEAKKADCLISYDPNFRPLLWPDYEEAKTQMRSVLPYTDLIKLSDEETELLTGIAVPEDAAKSLVEHGAMIAAVTLGAKGVVIASGNGIIKVPAFQVEAVDTTGAGDAFWGAFLYCVGKYLEPASDSHNRRQLARTLDTPRLQEFARFANAAAAICVTRRGAIPAMPDHTEIQALMHSK